MLLWKRGSALVSTENKNPWIPYCLICLNKWDWWGTSFCQWPLRGWAKLGHDLLFTQRKTPAHPALYLSCSCSMSFSLTLKDNNWNLLELAWYYLTRILTHLLHIQLYLAPNVGLVPPFVSTPSLILSFTSLHSPPSGWWTTWHLSHLSLLKSPISTVPLPLQPGISTALIVRDSYWQKALGVLFILGTNPWKQV